MADLGTLLASGLFLAFAAHRALTVWRGADPAQRYIAGFAACLGTAMLFRAPVVVSALHRMPPLDTAVMLLTHELKTVAHALLLLVALSLRPTRADRRPVRRQVLLALAVLAAGAALLLAAGVRVEDGLATAPVQRRVFLAAYNVLFASYGSWCLLVLVRELLGQARQVAAGPLRTGLRLMTLAALTGTVWTLWVLTYIPTNLARGYQLPSEDTVCSVLGVVTAALATGGATATWWAALPEGPLGAPGRWLFAYRTHRALEPLWSALRTELPQIALDPAADRRPPLRRAEFALYRRVIEIHDGHLALRPYIPTAVPEWAAGATDRYADRRAVLAAASIAAALETRRAGHRPPDARPPGPGPFPMAGTLAAEAAWLLQVTAAFTTSPTVATVRTRARSACGPDRESA
ncbi:MAB_1171c family putative transporter [Streptomyces sp. NPDC060002]|uniref:MAB_1171c family putative transporter n=1 Tax=Streptomyces sp. NPDC060002 TaxID=3347033 RepID=UPI0036B2897B